MMRRALLPFRLRYRRLRLFGVATRATGLASVLLFGMIWADRLAAFPSRARLAIVLGFGAIVGAYVVARLVDILLISFDHVALCLDRYLGSSRHGVLTAWQLDSARDRVAQTPAEAALEARHIATTIEAVQKLSPVRAFPSERFARECRYLAPVAVCLLLLLVWGGWSIVPRYFDPYHDHPPYSGLRFTVTPAAPRVIYGEDIEVGVTVAGGLPDEVVLVTEDETGLRRSPCFRAPGNSFTQRIEKVTRPLKFWFAAGQARSKWQNLELVLIPKIVSLRLTMVPPDYTLLPPQSLIVGQKPVRAPRGSFLELTVFSNRPLSGGLLTIHPLEGKGESVAVKSTQRSPRAVTFRWKLTRSAQLKLRITDIEGHPSRDDFAFYQEAVPDQKPEIFFEHPRPLVLATPDSQIHFQVRAQDDYGLKDLKLFRCLKDFRETVRGLPLEKPYACDSSHQGTFDLKTFGVRPGDNIEFFGEASDYNPLAVGLAVSAVYQIKVISEKDYLTIQHHRARLADFERRYALLQRELNRLVKEARRLQKALEQNQPEAQAQARQRFRKQLEETLWLFKKFSEAKPLYDVEKEFQERIAPTYRGLRQLQALMRRGQLSPQALKAFADAMTQKDQPELDQIRKTTKLMTQAARVKRLESEFQQIVRQQELLQRRLSTLKNRSRIPEELGPYGQEQKAVEQRLEQFVGKLTREIKGLPEELAPLKKSAQQFLSVLRQLDPQKDMAQCQASCRAGQGGPSYTSARVAYEKLRQLLSCCSGGSVGQGLSLCQAFRPSMMQTSLQQLMKAQGLGREGAGLAGESGYSMNLPTASNVQLAGPAVLGGMRTGGGRGRGGDGANGTIREVQRERISPTHSRRRQFKFDPNEPFPEKYRDQLIEYFKRITQEPLSPEEKEPE